MRKLVFALMALFLFVAFAPQALAKNIKGSIEDLMKKNARLRCTYTYKDNNQSFKGTIFVNGKKFRTEMKMPINNKTATFYSVSDGTTLYSWNNQIKQGTKMNLKKMQALAKENTNQAGSDEEYRKMSQEMSKKYQYKCAAANSKASFFRPPKNVEFVDLSKMMEGFQNMGAKIQEGAKNMEQNACGICNNLPENIRQECLANCK